MSSNKKIRVLRRVSKVEEVYLDRDEALKYIVEAKCHAEGEIDLYIRARDQPGYIQRVQTIKGPTTNKTEEELLEYAKKEVDIDFLNLT